ncbi:MAG: hypothetical protein PUB94_02225 [Oscillospiraceae bacterium]|nr:hypothetical protein [Oscillospiraceae bacterium]
MTKKLTAAAVAVIMLFSVFTVPASAESAEFPQAVTNAVYSVLDRAVTALLTFLNRFWPGYESKWDSADSYKAESFYPGEENFDASVKQNAKWRLGYSGASLLDGLDIMNGEFFLAGGLEAFKGRAPKEILDDQRVRVFALGDSEGGTVLYASIDGFGISRGDVQQIRSRIADFAKENGVISVNVSVLHQHSCIDTLGMGVPLVNALVFNTGNAASKGKIEQLKIQKNKQFMENLFDTTVRCMKEAVENMKGGSLSYGEADISDLIADKRSPYFYDGAVHRLRFVPDDGSAETWIVEAGIHAVSFGASTDRLSADFPYYIEKNINETVGANVVYIQGAELAVTADKTSTSAEGASTLDNVKAYANEIAGRLKAISDEEALEPVLNIAHREVYLDVTNQVLTLAAREDILNAVIVRDGKKYKMVTEIGYMELGGNVGVFLCPGEFEPGIIYDGAVTTAEESWSKTSWPYSPLASFTGCEHVMVFGLCNDQAGYVMTDNAYRSMFTENEEINVISRTAGSTFAKAYIDLLQSVK